MERQTSLVREKDPPTAEMVDDEKKDAATAATASTTNNEDGRQSASKKSSASKKKRHRHTKKKDEKRKFGKEEDSEDEGRKSSTDRVATTEQKVSESQKNLSRNDSVVDSSDRGITDARDPSEDDTDPEDMELMKAAAAWAASSDDEAADTAEDQEESKTHPHRHSQQHQHESSSTSQAPTPTSWSVHVTQLSYKATQLEIRLHFASKGCSIASIRLVYDAVGSFSGGRDDGGAGEHQQQRKKFRGVAFIDFDDEESYRLALNLDKSRLLGRKINVRPTKSAQELADIVRTTKEKVAVKIREQKQQKKRSLPSDDANGGGKAPSTAKSSYPNTGSNIRGAGEGSDKKRRRKDQQMKTKDKSSSSSSSKAKHDAKKSPQKKITTKRERHVKRSPERKLTKKERNRRAAIIMSQRKKRKG